MREQLGIIVNEDADGQVSVQLLAAPDEALKSFSNMHGKPQDKPSRVTFIGLNFKDNESVVRSKDLPVQDPPKDEQPDGIVLGQGPIWLDKEKDDGSGS